MAKGNLFLGMGSGSVGDVTFYRTNGAQISRARNRKPRNPRTDAQLIQRAVSATVSQAYAAGKAIFDHAFEGRSVPAGNQHRFMSLNMRILRERVLAGIEDGGDQSITQLGTVASPRQPFAVPNSYRISEGSLIQNLFEVVSVASERTSTIQVQISQPQADETVSAYASRLGLSAGDIYTICAFATRVSDTEDLVSPQTIFGFIRLTVRSELAQKTTPMASATYNDLFIVGQSRTQFLPIQPITQVISISQIAGNTSYSTGSMGIIRSNENSGLRSTSDMVTPKELSIELDNEWGVKSTNLLAAWSDATAATQSPLILEGGAIDKSKPGN